MSDFYRRGLLHPRRIVFARATTDRGGNKVRPMIIVDRRADIRPGGNFYVVVCSTRFTRPIRDLEVELPSLMGPTGHPATRLHQETVAVCDWVVSIAVDDIIEAKGHVPQPLFEEICQKVGIVPIPY